MEKVDKYGCIQMRDVCSILLAEINKLEQVGEKQEIILNLIKESISRISAIVVLTHNKQWKESLILWRSLYEIECIATLLHRSESDGTIKLFKELKISKNPLKTLKENGYKAEGTRDKHRSKENLKNYGWIIKIKGYGENINFTFAGVQKLAFLGSEKMDTYKYSSAISHNSIFAESEIAEGKINQVLWLTVSQIFRILDEVVEIQNEDYLKYKENLE